MGADETSADDLADHHGSLSDHQSQVGPLLMWGAPGFGDSTHRARDYIARLKMWGEASLAAITCLSIFTQTHAEIS